MRFKDARAAGRSLAAALEAYSGRADVVVIAVARGGVGVGAEVARRLSLPLDLLLLRRLLVPRGSLEPDCVASVAGSTFLDEGLAAAAADESDLALRQYLADAFSHFDSYVRACRGERPALALAGQTVLLVDNGVRTGSTMLAAVRAVRSRSPARVVAAAPVADPVAHETVAPAVEEFVCLATPEPFGHVGLWYADFSRPSDDEIRAVLAEQ